VKKILFFSIIFCSFSLLHSMDKPELYVDNSIDGVIERLCPLEDAVLALLDYSSLVARHLNLGYNVLKSNNKQPYLALTIVDLNRKKPKSD
jgi:hypothetical protein